ncbi:MAG TPA: glycosyl hydrolase family 18 protein [Thermoleophilia bacterium]|nr:glycosyl hydrolase family 18 protein [Thermoleophilia bacterium]
MTDSSQAGVEREDTGPPRGATQARPSRDERRSRLRRQRLLVLLAAAGALAVVLVLLFTVGPFGSHLGRPGAPPLGYLREPLGGRTYRVTAWTLGDAASLQAAAAAQAVDEVDFDWYHTQADGSVTAERQDPDLVGAARGHDLNLFATVTNSTTANGAFSRAVAAAVLATPDRRRRFVSDLVALVKHMGYDGVDLDWEDLKPADRAGFTTLVEELAAALHAEHRFLSIAVMPKTSEPGEWDNQKYADWRRIGEAVDEFKIMTYSYSGPWGAPGPQAPLAWVDRVLTFAERTVPPGKILMGLPFYGFDWHHGSVATVSAHRAAALAAQYGATAHRDAASGEATMAFNDESGAMHVVWFQDRQAVAGKLAALRERHPKVAGISAWVMGQEASGFWPLITRRLR